MNDFERRDDRLDDHVQVEHLDPLDTFQEQKIYRTFQLLGFLWKTHRWGRRGILSGCLLIFLALLCLLVFSNALPLSSPQRNIPLLLFPQIPIRPTCKTSLCTTNRSRRRRRRCRLVSDSTRQCAAQGAHSR